MSDKFDYRGVRSARVAQKAEEGYSKGAENPHRRLIEELEREWSKYRLCE
jgi:hypothetical protein